MEGIHRHCVAVMLFDAALEAHEALSGIFGSISLTSWVFLLVPQLVENYRCGSADGVSLAFLAVWFVGDVSNLAGAVLADLIPTVIALSIYFCFADAILIGQCVYYRTINARKAARHAQRTEDTSDDARQPLLRRSSDNIGLPGSRRRSSASHPRRTSSMASPLPVIKEEPSTGRTGLKNFAAIVAVCLVGTAGWAIAWKTTVWTPTPTPTSPPGLSSNEDGDSTIAALANALGYFSAICYLGARIPQITKNYRERSCEGLSLLFFMLSVLGNATYGAGILFHSTETRYVLINLPWLIGSLGTIFEDTVIFIQFHMYSTKVRAGTESSSAIE